MPGSRKVKAADFPVVPTRRSPADELGPRANRTIAKILEATRSIFLRRGYAGTTIDEIAQEAGVSRASFYTYFPTKRDVLLTLGADSARAADAMVEVVQGFAGGWTRGDVERFVAAYFDLLDSHGSFTFAWTQAANIDEEIREAGQARHLGICRRFGEALGAARTSPYRDPTAIGLVWFAMLERAWSYCQLYDSIDPANVQQEIVALLEAELRSR